MEELVKIETLEVTLLLYVLHLYTLSKYLHKADRILYVPNIFEKAIKFNKPNKRMKNPES